MAGRARKFYEWFFGIAVPVMIKVGEDLGDGPVGTSYWPVIILIIVGVCVYLVLT